MIAEIPVLANMALFICFITGIGYDNFAVFLLGILFIIPVTMLTIEQSQAKLKLLTYIAMVIIGGIIISSSMIVPKWGIPPYQEFLSLRLSVVFNGALGWYIEWVNSRTDLFGEAPNPAAIFSTFTGFLGGLIAVILLYRRTFSTEKTARAATTTAQNAIDNFTLNREAAYDKIFVDSANLLANDSTQAKVAGIMGLDRLVMAKPQYHPAVHSTLLALILEESKVALDKLRPLIDQKHAMTHDYSWKKSSATPLAAAAWISANHRAQNAEKRARVGDLYSSHAVSSIKSLHNIDCENWILVHHRFLGTNFKNCALSILSPTSTSLTFENCTFEDTNIEVQDWAQPAEKTKRYESMSMKAWSASIPSPEILVSFKNCTFKTGVTLNGSNVEQTEKQSIVLLAEQVRRSPKDSSNEVS